MPKSAPKKPIKDEREWTTPEQKAFLQSKMDEYVSAREKKTVPAWLRVTYKEYFALFPTLEITVGDASVHGKTWTFREKHLYEEKVSG